MASCIVGFRMSLLLHVLLCICSFFYFYIFRQRYLHNYITHEVHILYAGWQWQVVSWDRRPAFSCLFFHVYMFTFLSLYAFRTVIFRQNISKTIQDRNFIFGIQVDNGKLYHRIENEPSPICSSLYLFFFLSLYIFCQRYLHNCITQEVHILYIGWQWQVI